MILSQLMFLSLHFLSEINKRKIAKYNASQKMHWPGVGIFHKALKALENPPGPSSDALAVSSRSRPTFPSQPELALDTGPVQ